MLFDWDLPRGGGGSPECDTARFLTKQAMGKESRHLPSTISRRSTSKLCFERPGSSSDVHGSSRLSLALRETRFLMLGQLLATYCLYQFWGDQEAKLERLAPTMIVSDL